MVTEAEIQPLRSGTNELEARLKFIYRCLNIECADPNSDPVLSPQIQNAIRRGNKIDAIKIYRELTSVGLAKPSSRADGNEAWIIKVLNTNQKGFTIS